MIYTLYTNVAFLLFQYNENYFVAHDILPREYIVINVFSAVQKEMRRITQR